MAASKHALGDGFEDYEDNGQKTKAKRESENRISAALCSAGVPMVC